MAQTPRARARTIPWVHKRLYEIPFAGTVAANTHSTLLSSAIMFAFQIVKVKMFFDTDHINNVRYYFLYSKNRSVGTTAPPPDSDICSPLGVQRYFVGNGFMREALCNLPFEKGRNYLKVHVHNTNAFAIQANASILIWEL